MPGKRIIIDPADKGAYNLLSKTKMAWADAVECRKGRWYIKMGYAGYNSRVNNYDGYDTETAAILAIRRYQQA